MSHSPCPSSLCTVHNIPSLLSQDFSNILSVLQSVKARDEGKGETGGGGPKPKPVEEPHHQRSQPPPSHGYNRYDQEKFGRQEGGCGLCVSLWVDWFSTGSQLVMILFTETEEFKIDTTLTYSGLTLKSVKVCVCDGDGVCV